MTGLGCARSSSPRNAPETVRWVFLARSGFLFLGIPARVIRLTPMLRLWREVAEDDLIPELRNHAPRSLGGIPDEVHPLQRHRPCGPVRGPRRHCHGFEPDHVQGSRTARSKLAISPRRSGLRSTPTACRYKGLAARLAPPEQPEQPEPPERLARWVPLAPRETRALRAQTRQWTSRPSMRTTNSSPMTTAPTLWRARPAIPRSARGGQPRPAWRFGGW